MATWTDAALDLALKRTARRRERADGERRVARLDDRLSRLTAWRALPEGERPERERLPVRLESVQKVLRTVATVLAATPAGPALAGLALGVAAASRVAAALEGGNRARLIEAVTDEVSAQISDPEARDRVLEELEDKLL